jgi:GNAT superfamily N-acetyltransferase
MFGQIQPLTSADLPGCLALAQDRDWLPEERKWRLLFDLGIVYGVRGPGGELAGVTVLTRYGAGFAVIGMMLVATRYGGRGLGRALMTRALDDAGDATVFLHATPAGRPLYEKLGFVPVGVTQTHLGRFRPADPVPSLGGSRLAGPGDLMAIRRLDAQANGTDRAVLVRRLPGFTGQLRVVGRLGAVTGYAGAYDSLRYVSIGPVVAEAADDAKTLITDAAATAPGPVRIDLDDRHPRLLEWAAEHGLAPGVSSTAMVFGGRPLPGDRARCFAPVMRALG